MKIARFFYDYKMNDHRAKNNKTYMQFMHKIIVCMNVK